MANIERFPRTAAADRYGFTNQELGTLEFLANRNTYRTGESATKSNYTGKMNRVEAEAMARFARLGPRDRVLILDDDTGELALACEQLLPEGGSILCLSWGAEYNIAKTNIEARGAGKIDLAKFYWLDPQLCEKIQQRYQRRAEDGLRTFTKIIGRWTLPQLETPLQAKSITMWSELLRSNGELLVLLGRSGEEHQVIFETAHTRYASQAEEYSISVFAPEDVEDAKDHSSTVLASINSLLPQEIGSSWCMVRSQHLLQQACRAGMYRDQRQQWMQEARGKIRKKDPTQDELVAEMVKLVLARCKKTGTTYCTRPIQMVLVLQRVLVDLTT